MYTDVRVRASMQHVKYIPFSVSPPASYSVSKAKLLAFWDEYRRGMLLTGCNKRRSKQVQIHSGGRNVSDTLIISRVTL